MGRKFTLRPYKLKYPRRPVSVSSTATAHPDTNLPVATHQPCHASQQLVPTAKLPTAQQPTNQSLPPANSPEITISIPASSHPAANLPEVTPSSHPAVSMLPVSHPAVSPSSPSVDTEHPIYTFQQAATPFSSPVCHSYCLRERKITDKLRHYLSSSHSPVSPANLPVVSQQPSTSVFTQQSLFTSSQSPTSSPSNQLELASGLPLYQRSLLACNSTPCSLQTLCLRHNIIKELTQCVRMSLRAIPVVTKAMMQSVISHWPRGEDH